MSHGNINDPKHWRDRAAEMRALADTMKDAEATAIRIAWRTTMTSWQTAQHSAKSNAIHPS